MAEQIFGPTTWAVQTSERRPGPVLVTPERVVYLDDGNLRAVDSAGKDAWTLPIKFVDQPGGNQPGPLLRLVDSSTIATVQTGTVKGSGLGSSEEVWRVTLVSLADGTKVKQVDVPVTSDSAQLGPAGLVFGSVDATTGASLGDKATVVNAAGKVQKVTSEKRSAAGGTVTAVPSMAVGKTVVSAYSGTGGAGLPAFGFMAPGWTSAEAAPGKAYAESARVLGADADHLIFGVWTQRGSFGGEDARYQVLDAVSGKILAKPGCGPRSGIPGAGPDVDLSVSPSGRYVSAGNVIVDAETGKAECVGGGKKQKSVNFSSVDDLGRAFGMTGADASSSPQLVVAQQGQEPKVFGLPDGASAPLGVMQGGFAIFADSGGTISANPVK